MARFSSSDTAIGGILEDRIGAVWFFGDEVLDGCFRFMHNVYIMKVAKASGDGWTKVRFVTVDAEKERRRIRRLIAPHLARLIRHRFPSWDDLQAIDAATKAPRKARKGK